MDWIADVIEVVTGRAVAILHVQNRAVSRGHVEWPARVWAISSAGTGTGWADFPRQRQLPLRTPRAHSTIRLPYIEAEMRHVSLTVYQLASSWAF